MDQQVWFGWYQGWYHLLDELLVGDFLPEVFHYTWVT